LFPVPQPFGNDDEDWSPENEGGKQDMELGNDPDRGAVSGVRKVIDVMGGTVLFWPVTRHS